MTRERCSFSEIVIPHAAVVTPGLHATFLEICVLIRGAEVVSSELLHEFFIAVDNSAPRWTRVSEGSFGREAIGIERLKSPYLSISKIIAF